jgi:hypothetical protein
LAIGGVEGPGIACQGRETAIPAASAAGRRDLPFEGAFQPFQPSLRNSSADATLNKSLIETFSNCNLHGSTKDTVGFSMIRLLTLD